MLPLSALFMHTRAHITHHTHNLQIMYIQYYQGDRVFSDMKLVFRHGFHGIRWFYV